MLSGGAQVKFTVSGYSMYPLLHSNADTVILTKKQRIKKYDILLYKRENGEFVLHRVVGFMKEAGKKNGTMCMAGDFETKLSVPCTKIRL